MSSSATAPSSAAPLPALANLRDVARGLLPGLLREGVLLRSDAPIAGDSVPPDIAWPPAVVLDLRHPDEQVGEHPFAGHSAVHPISLVDPSAPGPAGPESDDGLARFYATLLGPDAAGLFVRIVGIVAESTGPVLIHCVAGKDRTGVTVALLLRLLGIDREAVIEEYLRTNLIAEALLARLRLQYSMMDHRRVAADRVTIASIEAPRRLIVHMLDHWDNHPGGALGWYLDNGGDARTAARLRERLVG